MLARIRSTRIRVARAVALACAVMLPSVVLADALEAFLQGSDYLLEIRSGASAQPIHEDLTMASGQLGPAPDLAFLASADTLIVGVASEDRGYVQVRGRAVGYQLAPRDDGAILLELAHLYNADRAQSAFQTQLVVHPGQWMVVEATEQQENTGSGVTTRYHYTLVRLTRP